MVSSVLSPPRADVLTKLKRLLLPELLEPPPFQKILFSLCILAKTARMKLFSFIYGPEHYKRFSKIIVKQKKNLQSSTSIKESNIYTIVNSLENKHSLVHLASKNVSVLQQCVENRTLYHAPGAPDMAGMVGEQTLLRNREQPFIRFLLFCYNSINLTVRL